MHVDHVRMPSGSGRDKRKEWSVDLISAIGEYCCCENGIFMFDSCTWPE